MCIMINKTKSALAGIVAIDKVSRSENYSRHAKDSIQTKIFKWIEYNVRKHDCTYSTGSTQSPVACIEFMFMISTDGAYSQSSEIKQEIIKRSALLEYRTKISFYSSAEHVKHKHVHQKMHPVRMNKSAADEAIPLLLLSDDIWMEDKPLPHFIVPEC